MIKSSSGRGNQEGLHRKDTRDEASSSLRRKLEEKRKKKKKKKKKKKRRGKETTIKSRTINVEKELETKKRKRTTSGRSEARGPLIKENQLHVRLGEKRKNLEMVRRRWRERQRIDR